jgi:predicted nucleic acid-binding protein
MRIDKHLHTVTRLFLDTAPVIYYAEKDARYLSVVDTIFDCLDSGRMQAVTSPVTLAECLVVPYRLSQETLRQVFSDIIINGANVVFACIDDKTGTVAAELRARYNISLTDALQVAVALQNDCEAFLTNDMTLKRLTELNILVLSELEL